MKILVVDDSLTHRKILKNCLNLFGLTDIVEAKNGIDALTKLNDIKLILTDLNMDQMDGLQFSKEVRSKGLKIPIIMITSNSDKADMEEALNAGVNDFVTKPFNNNDLLTKIKKYSIVESNNSDVSYVKNDTFVERRKSVRFKNRFSLKYRILNQNSEYYFSFCEDISIGGLKFLSTLSFNINDKLEIILNLNEEVIEPLNLQAAVKWSLKSDKQLGKFEVGVAFQNIEIEKLNVLKQFIKTDNEIKNNNA